jgi:hypothetical protein
MKANVLLRWLRPGALLLSAAIILLAGCARETSSPLSVSPDGSGGMLSADASLNGTEGRTTVRQDGSTPPEGLVTASFGDADLRLWPYTGSSFAGAGVDPVNLVFVGKASPEQIRNALLALDGNRAPLGFPDAPPFNMPWKDAMGDVQTCYVEPAGWVGSEIQLTIGDYDPVRFHLRLFRTASPYGDGGWWTVGAAHFEVLIPGTTEHQVLSWERAEEIVVADLMRSGLLDATVPMNQTTIGPSPSWRAIPAFLYNELPADLRNYIGGPAVPVSEDVPLVNDGRATVLNLAGVAEPAGPRHDSFTVNMHQVVPRPFCNGGPLDYVMVEGPIYFEKNVDVGMDGQLAISGRAAGTIMVTPVDVTQNPPVPTGGPWYATVSDQHEGTLAGQTGRVMFQVKRILPQDQGSEMIMTKLMVGTNGQDSYTLREKCLGEELTR